MLRRALGFSKDLGTLSSAWQAAPRLFVGSSSLQLYKYVCMYALRPKPWQEEQALAPNRGSVNINGDAGMHSPQAFDRFGGNKRNPLSRCKKVPYLAWQVFLMPETWGIPGI